MGRNNLQRWFTVVFVALLSAPVGYLGAVSVVIKNTQGSVISAPDCTLQPNGLQVAPSLVDLTVDDACVTLTPAVTYSISVTPTTTQSIAPGSSFGIQVRLSATPTTPVLVRAVSSNSAVANITSPSGGELTLSSTAAATISVTVPSSANIGQQATITISCPTATCAITPSTVVVSVASTTPTCSDPLTDPWEVSSSCFSALYVSSDVSKLTVKDPTASYETFVPDRCATSFMDYHVWSVRQFVTTVPAAYMSVFIRPAECGETVATYDMALSKVPGSMTKSRDANGNLVDLPNGCRNFTVSAPSVYGAPREYAGDGSVYCPIDSNTTYYVNVRLSASTAPTNCGVGSKKCDVRNVSDLPHL